MVSELEHETMKKRSRENSVHSDKPEPVKKKKSKGKKKAVRDYKRENELRKIRRLAKSREKE